MDLAAFFAPLLPADFWQLSWQQKPEYVAGHPEKFRAVFDWDSLNAILNGPYGPQLRLVLSGTNHFYRKSPLTLGAILQDLRQGATLVLDEIDAHHAPLFDMCQRLGEASGQKVHANLYLSAPGQAGYPVHYDDHGFVAMQIYGHKRWRIFPPTEASLSLERDEQAQAPPEDLLLSTWKMSPGDWLYLPRAYWHDALAEESHSLHLTLGFSEQEAFSLPLSYDFPRQLLGHTDESCA